MSGKKLFAFSLILLLLTSASLTAFAHSGRTDSSGGHYDDGDYHYHHGYPAHDHYDMDGDGVRDCPYRFDDKTGSNSGTSKGGNDVTSTTDKEVADVPTWVYWIFALQFIIVLALFIIIRAKKQDIEDLKHSHEIEIEQIKQSCDKQLTERKATKEELQKLNSRVYDAKKEYEELCRKRIFEEIELEKAKKIRSRIKNAPLDISFTENGMPIYWKYNPKKPYGDYTVFANRKTGIYHADYFCAPYFAVEDHIFNVVEQMRPCKKCAEGFYGFTAVPEWFNR